MTNQTIDQTKPELNQTEYEHIEIELEESRQALHTILILAVFTLLWVGSAVAAIMTDYAWFAKSAIILIAFPLWGCFINRFVIGWTLPIVRPKER